MKFTEYFHYMHDRPDRRSIKFEWIEKVVMDPEHEFEQSDRRIRRWKRIPEAGDKYLRVVLLKDGETVHNAFSIDLFGRKRMNVKYFPDTDTLVVNFNSNKIVDTRDLNENVLIELDEAGHLVSITIEHAKDQTNVSEFTYQLATV